MTALLPLALGAFLGAAALLPLGPGAYRPMVERHRGAMVMVAFWATWCEPCREELPRLQMLARRSGGRVRLVTVSTDEPEQARAAERFLQRVHVGAERYRVSGTEVISEVDGQWGGVLPAVFVYDAAGELRGRLTGEMDWAKLQQLILPVQVNHPSGQHR